MSMNALSVHVSAEHVSTLSVSMSATVRTVLLEPTVNGVSVYDMAAIVSMSTGKLPSCLDTLVDILEYHFQLELLVRISCT